MLNGQTSGHLRLRTLPLALGAIVATTAVPYGVRVPTIDVLELSPHPFDVVTNVLLYIPLGIALSRYSLGRIVLSGAALSFAVECLQLFLASRHPGLPDLIANTAGAFAGGIVGRRLLYRGRETPDFVYLGRRRGAGAGLVLVLLVGVWAILQGRGMATDFSNWDRSCRLVAGDEVTRDKPWIGEIWEAAIIPAVVDSSLIRELAKQGPGSISRNLHHLPEAPVYRLESPIDLERIRGQPLLTAVQEEKLFDSLVRAGELTVLAWCRIQDVNQGHRLNRGPSRIISYSKNRDERNFTLAQNQRRIVFRLRTPRSGINGQKPGTESPPLLVPNTVVLLAASYDGRMSCIYLNGRRVAEKDIATADRFYGFLQPEVVTPIPVFLGALVAITVLGLAQAREVKRRFLLGVLAGVFGAVLFVAGDGAAARVPWYGSWLPTFAIIGGIVVAGSGSSCGYGGRDASRSQS